jgi:N-acetylglucosaminyldiphosphoundecaprenol N-acetyl-beta-D-mannosaminyltransferase
LTLLSWKQMCLSFTIHCVLYCIFGHQVFLREHPIEMTIISILNTTIHNLSMEQTLDLIHKAIQEKKQIHHVVVNAGKMVAMQKDAQLRQSVNNSDIINADGQAVVWASKFLGKPLKERVAGIDLMENLVEMAHKKDYKIFLFGAKEEVVSETVKIYQQKHNPNIIAGYRNGYFKKEDEVGIAKQISDSGAQLLFVAITSPIKENFLYKHRKALKNINLIMGVGGSFDVISGKTKRAPVWMQNAGLEWFYRFAQEPKRMWKRYLVGNTTFMYLVLKEKLKRS